MLSKYAYSKRLMSAWIEDRLIQIQKSHPERVIGIVVDKSDILKAADNHIHFEFI
jgi:hypothetical protein